jgi:hypothetical protein
VLDLESVRSLDLHRYMVRLNLLRGSGRRTIAAETTEILASVWGDPVPLPAQTVSRAFIWHRTGRRRVAESPEMAGDDPLMTALFRIDGVAEVVEGQGLVLVRLGRLFSWEEPQRAVREVLDSYGGRGSPISASG